MNKEDLMLFNLIEKRKISILPPSELNITQSEFNFLEYNEFIHKNKLTEYCVKHPGIIYSDYSEGTILFTNIIDQIIVGLKSKVVYNNENNSYNKANYLISLFKDNEIFFN